MWQPSKRRSTSSEGRLLQQLEAALAKRAALLADPQTDAVRLFHSTADGIDGLVIEKLGDVLVAQLHQGRLTVPEEAARTLCAWVARKVQARAVYRKVFPKDRSTAGPELERLHSDATPWIGEPAPPEITVREAGITFLVRPYDGYATGLFLDHRGHRARIRELAAGRQVLNAFAYTCAFTVAAALGGAATTVSLDISKKHLEWGKRNLAANGIELPQHRFIRSDVFEYYRRAQRQGHRFDLLILDPPTFARVKRPRRSFTLTEDLVRLAEGAVRLSNKSGYILLSVNHRGTSEDRLRQVLHDAARRHMRRCTQFEAVTLPEDFAGDPGHARSLLARLS